MRDVKPFLLVGLLVGSAFDISHGALTVVAELGADFSGTSNPNAPSHGNGTWAFYWNQPDNWVPDYSTSTSPAPHTWDPSSAVLGDTTRYALLASTGNGGTPWTPDGNTTGNDSNPDRFIRFQSYVAGTNSIGLHPGAQPGFDPDGVGPVPTNLVDRYAIAAFTVNSADFYHITDGILWTPGDTSNGVDVWVHVNNGSPVLLGASAGNSDTAAQGFQFSYALGDLNPGDTIYVAFGTNGNPGSDGSRANFAVAVPEPAKGVLILLGLGLALSRRSRK